MSDPADRTELFTQHSRDWARNRYVYPVISRRSKGLSVGINLNTDRICNFDCVYCCVDRTGGARRPEHVETQLLKEELSDMLQRVSTGEIWRIPPFDTTPASLRRFADIAFSGDGEPTASGAFVPACHLAVGLRDAFAADAKIVVITNATLLDRAPIRSAMEFLDQHKGEIWAKLDAGNPELYQRMVRTSVPFERILGNILLAGQSREIVIQSMFLRFHDEAPSAKDVDDYLARLSELKAGGCRIRLVQVYTIARPVFEADISPMPDAPLDDIAARVRELGLAAEAYYGASRRPAE